MLDLFSDFYYLPLIWQLMIIASISGLYLAFSAPMLIWSITGLVFLYLCETPPIIMAYTTLALSFVSLPWLRKHTLSRLILIIAKKLKIFPKVSETEKAAIEAGTVWMDKELFSGSANLSTLLHQDIKELTADDRNFLEGPCEELCTMINDWEIQKTKQIPDDVWNFIKENKFLGMIIPKEYNGLGLSTNGVSSVLEKLATVSGTIAITVMVPNSLGPAELLLHYGTKAQKDRYLSNLATGIDIPCFGLTEPTAGSDAGNIQSDAVVFKDKDGKLKLKFNFEKRWISLSGISTLIGLAFLLKDPDKLLGNHKNYGITCALIPTNTPGIDVSKQHDPLSIPFNNCPFTGKDVILPLDCIIGEKKGYGHGWKMLMDCLSAGRGVSIPSSNCGSAQAVARAVSAFSIIRQQFGTSIGNFEGIEEPLSRIAGKTLLLKAGRRYTCGAIDQGEKPSVVSAIMKYHSSEINREIVNDGMDILGGAGITQGPRNAISSAYKAIPITITVEGANILTRTLIIFGQGVLRCHPYAFLEVATAEKNDLKGFDKAFFGHIYHIIKTNIKAGLFTITKGLIIPRYGTFLSPYKRKLKWSSALFATVADAAMLWFGGRLKTKQKITGRLADVLSWMYFATATMSYYDSLHDEKYAMQPIFKWALDTCYYNIQIAFIGFFENFTPLTRLFIAPWFRLFPIGRPPSDACGKKVAKLMLHNQSVRNTLTSGIHVPNSEKTSLGKYELTYQKLIHVEPIIRAIKTAIKSKKLPKKPISQLIDKAVKKDIISADDAIQLKEAEAARLDAIQVDSFTKEEYLTL